MLRMQRGDHDSGSHRSDDTDDRSAAHSDAFSDASRARSACRPAHSERGVGRMGDSAFLGSRQTDTCRPCGSAAGTGTATASRCGSTRQPAP